MIWSLGPDSKTRYPKRFKMEVQGYGRSIRSNKDWAVTYVLDSGFVNFVKKNSNILPDWFTQAIVVSSREGTAFIKCIPQLKRIRIQSQTINTIHPLFLNSNM